MHYVQTNVHITDQQDKTFDDAPPDLSVGQSVRLYYHGSAYNYVMKYRTSQGLNAEAQFASDGLFYPDPGFKVSPK